jgi:hypothetical protein
VIDATTVGVSFGESINKDDTVALLKAFGIKDGTAALDTAISASASASASLPPSLARTSPFLTHPVFNTHRYAILYINMYLTPLYAHLLNPPIHTYKHTHAYTHTHTHTHAHTVFNTHRSETQMMRYLKVYIHTYIHILSLTAYTSTLIYTNTH